jgi:hypothetical protein
MENTGCRDCGDLNVVFESPFGGEMLCTQCARREIVGVMSDWDDETWTEIDRKLKEMGVEVELEKIVSTLVYLFISKQLDITLYM